MARVRDAVLLLLLLTSAWTIPGQAASWQVPATGPTPAGGRPLKDCTGKGTVSFMFWGDKGENIEQTSLVREAMKACPGLKVNAIWKQTGYDEALATGIGAANAPDLFLLDTKRLPEYGAQGALQDLGPFVKKDKLNLGKLFWKNCLPLTMYRNHVFGLERDCGNNGMLLYNKDLFDARHVTYPTNSWTYADFARAAVALSGTYSIRSDPEARVRYGTPILRDDPHINQYLWAWGADWMSSNLRRCTLTTTPARAALQWWHDLAYTKHGAATPDQEAAVGGDSAGFTSQRFAMRFVGPWALDYLLRPSAYTHRSPVKFRWGVALPPKGPKGNTGPLLSAVVSMYAQAKNKKAAWWLLKFLTLGTSTQILGNYGIAIPGAVRAAHSAAFDQEYRPYTRTWLAGQQRGRWMRVVPKEDAWWSAVNTSLEPFWRGQISVNAATSMACSGGILHLPQP